MHSHVMHMHRARTWRIQTLQWRLQHYAVVVKYMYLTSLSDITHCASHGPGSRLHDALIMNNTLYAHIVNYYSNIHSNCSTLHRDLETGVMSYHMTWYQAMETRTTHFLPSQIQSQHEYMVFLTLSSPPPSHLFLSSLPPSFPSLTCTLLQQWGGVRW